GRLPDQFYGGSVGPIGKVETTDPIIGPREPYPGGRIPRRLLDRITEIPFRRSVVAAIEVLQTKLARFIRRQELEIGRLLHGGGDRRNCGFRRGLRKCSLEDTPGHRDCQKSRNRRPTNTQYATGRHMSPL